MLHISFGDFVKWWWIYGEFTHGALGHVAYKICDETLMHHSIDKFNSGASPMHHHLVDVHVFTEYLGLFIFIPSFQVYLKFTGRCIDGTRKIVEFGLQEFLQAPETLSFQPPELIRQAQSLICEEDWNTLREKERILSN